LELVISKRKKGWVVDLRNIGIISQADQEWYDKDFLPRAANAGIKRIGATIPESAFARLSAAKYIAETKEAGIWVRYFADIEEAREWVKKS
jgi:hypothetical protein